MTTTLAYIPSPAQGVWQLGPFPLRAYALFIIAGIIVALVLGDRRWEARGGERGVIYDIALWAVPFGLIGGRMYHVLTDWPTYFGANGAGLGAAFRVWDGGLGIWGAVAFGAVGAWIACRRRGIPLPAFGDAIAPGIVLAQAIGRLGNYFNQELYGRATTVPWGLEIYERRNANGVLDPLNGVSTGELIEVVHPTFLYELLWNVLVFAVLIWVDRRYRIGHGRLFALYVAGYCLGRFWIELMRSDVATLIAGIRINSFTSMLVFIGAVVYIMVAPKGREDPATLRGNAAEAEKSTDAPVEDVAKELTAVASTTGVVAAAKVAGDAEAEDAEAAAAENEPPEDDGEPTQVEAAVEAEALAVDVAEAPAEEIAEAQEFAAAGEAADAEEAEAEPAEAVVEAEALAEEVAEAPAEDIAEAEEFAAAGEAADAEADGSVGSVEGDEAAEAMESADEAHAVAVEGVEAAEAIEAEAGTAELEADSVEPEAEPAEAAVEAEALAEEVDEAPAEEITEAQADGSVGSVEGDEVAEAMESADQAHAVAVGGIEEAEAEAADAEPAEAEAPAEDVGSVEGDEAVEVEESADEAHEATVEGLEQAEAVEAEAEAEATEAEPAEAESAELEAGPAEAQDEAEAPAEDIGTVEAVEAEVAAEPEPQANVAKAEEAPRKWWQRRR